MSTLTLSLIERSYDNVWFTGTFNYDNTNYWYAPRTEIQTPGSAGSIIGWNPDVDKKYPTSNPILFGSPKNNGACFLEGQLQGNTPYIANVVIWYSSNGTQWSQGSTSASLAFSTYPEKVSNVSVNYNANTKEITIKWTQEIGGGAETIYDSIVLEKNGSSTATVIGRYEAATNTNNSITVAKELQIGASYTLTFWSRSSIVESDISHATSSAAEQAILEKVKTTFTFTAAHNPPVNIISPWDWTTSNGSATAADTQAAYNAMVNKTAFSNFKATVWNDLVNKLNELIVAKGMTWQGTIPNSKSSGDTFYATDFNAFATNFNRINDPALNLKSSGDAVIGSTFIDIVIALNVRINQYNNYGG